MDIKKKRELCSTVFFGWILAEKNNLSATKGNKDVEELFTSQMILKKFKAFDIDIEIPDMLLLILHLCVNGNPGQFQVVLKDLLLDIKEKHGKPIPSGYAITVADFIRCFMMDFPIIEIPRMNEKYEAMWDAQKNYNAGYLESDNLCDTPEWWKEVME